MRILQSNRSRSLTLLAVGTNGLVVAASGVFGAGGDVDAWEAASGERLWAHSRPAVNAVALTFALDGRALLAADSNGTSLLELGSNPRDKPVEESRTGWSDATVVVAGGRVLVGRVGGGARFGGGAALTAWQLPELSLLWKNDRWPAYTHFAAGGAATSGGDRVAMSLNVHGPRPEFAVTVRAADTGAEVMHLRLDGPQRQLAFTADGAKLLVRDDSRTVQVFDAASGARAGELVHRGRPFVTAVAVHPRGAVACARTDGTVTFWDADRLEAIRTLDWKAGKLVSLAFSPDGALAAAGTEDGKIVVWDVDG